MPVEIKKLVIQAKLKEPDNNETNPSMEKGTAHLSADELEDIVEICVKNILKILERDKKR